MSEKTTQKKIYSIIPAAVAFCAICILPQTSVSADKPDMIRKSGSWSSYKYFENSSPVCFMISEPASRKGNYTARGDTYFIITHRPADKTKDVVSFVAGYTYKTGSSVNITIDGKKFTMFTQGDTAWAPDGAADKRLTQAILKGSKLIIKGTSSRGTATTDTFSLKGSSAAYKDIGAACKM